MSIQVIGAGYGRTGTKSLKHALEKLGFDKCYHMVEVGRNPQHTPIWLKAAAGQPVNWDQLFAGYKATVDFPSTMFVPELTEQYPDAKVILTLRDPESWYESASQTIFRLPPRAIMPILWVMSFFKDNLKMLMSIAPVARKIVYQSAFGGDLSKENAIRAFNEHNEKILQTVPSEKLLVYEVSQGWEPLCEFLDVPVPNEPFPRTNSRKEFQQRVAINNKNS